MKTTRSLSFFITVWMAEKRLAEMREISGQVAVVDAAHASILQDKLADLEKSLLGMLAGLGQPFRRGEPNIAAQAEGQTEARACCKAVAPPTANRKLGA